MERLKLRVILLLLGILFVSLFVSMKITEGFETTAPQIAASPVPAPSPVPPPTPPPPAPVPTPSPPPVPPLSPVPTPPLSPPVIAAPERRRQDTGPKLVSRYYDSNPRSFTKVDLRQIDRLANKGLKILGNAISDSLNEGFSTKSSLPFSTYG